MKTWFTPAEILPFAVDPLPTSLAGLQEYILRQGWRADRQRARVRFAQGGGYEYNLSLLPLAVRSAILADEGAEVPATSSIGVRRPLWDVFERLSPGAKGKAMQRLTVVQAVHAIGSDVSRQAAVATIAGDHGVAASSIWNWLARVEGVDRSDWLPTLADQRCGGGKSIDIPQDAWDYFIADKLRPEDPTLTSCYERTKRAASRHGWGELPSLKTFERRLKREIPVAAQVFATQGAEAARRMTPSQRRDRTVYASLEAVNADGYRHNVFVRWPDGTIARPISIAFQDIRSGKWLARRTDRSENKEAVRLAIADMISDHGIPEHTFFDNGRHFAAKWLTGRMKFRFRFRIRDEEPEGILKTLGVQVHFTTPYRGQSKPIERSFRDIGEYIDKHPLFAGAFTGRNPLAKPENYGHAAVPIEVFERVCADEVAAHNAREGRRGFGMDGRSFDQVFRDHAPDLGFRKASSEQRRLFLLAAEGVTARRPDGRIELFDNRFWSEALGGLIGKKLTVRFDPQNLADGVEVYTSDNRFVAHAERLDDIGFNSVDDAREVARQETRIRRAQRELLDASIRLETADLKRLTPIAPPSETPPPAKVQRLVAGGGRRPAPRVDFEALDSAVTALAGGVIIPLNRR